MFYTVESMKLIIGLGNPEERYKNTRHNIGFRVVSEYSAGKRVGFQQKDKFKAFIAELSVDGEKIILAKPTTYYNNVGESARLISDFYKIEPADILVIHDELALPFGTIRTRIGGSDAGNNGIKSIAQHIGPDTARIRFGVYNDLRDRIDDADFVLSNFTKAEDDAFTELYKKAAAAIDAFISGTFEATTHSK
jgi:peptidyl-tRNA hydrolase, PTH1 family